MKRMVTLQLGQRSDDTQAETGFPEPGKTSKIEMATFSAAMFYVR